MSVPSSRVKQSSRLEGNSDPILDALVDSVYPAVDMLSDNNNKSRRRNSPDKGRGTENLATDIKPVGNKTCLFAGTYR